VSLVHGKVRLTITLLCQPFLFNSNKDATGCVLEYGECRGVSFLIDETSSTLIIFSLLTRDVIILVTSHGVIYLLLTLKHET